MEEIKIKLKELGFKDENIDGVINDVTQVILVKSFEGCLSKLPEEELSKLKKFTAKELEEYMKNNELPEFSKEEFKEIYNKTWGDYFKFIEK